MLAMRPADIATLCSSFAEAQVAFGEMHANAAAKAYHFTLKACTCPFTMYVCVLCVMSRFFFQICV